MFRRIWNEFESFPMRINPTAIDPSARPKSVSEVPIFEHFELILAEYGAKRVGVGYEWNGQQFASFSEMASAINHEMRDKPVSTEG